MEVDSGVDKKTTADKIATPLDELAGAGSRAKGQGCIQGQGGYPPAQVLYGRGFGCHQHEC
eukprot:309851-Karenia_brevis.AAC.1